MPKIDKLYAWIAEEADGGEGIVAVMHPGWGWMPLIGADKARIESFRQKALNSAKVTGTPIRLAEFSSMVNLERHMPGGKR